MTQRTYPSDRKSTFRGKSLLRLVENQDIRRSSHDEHKHRVLRRYGGPQGALLYVASTLSGHLATSERLLRQRIFDLHNRKNILDIGSGAGQLLGPLLKYADADAQITGCDLSANMLRRAKQRLKTNRPVLMAADMVHLPFADETFDCLTCGFVLEHLPDARVGLREMRRVLSPGGSMLLLVTEDSFSGAWTSRIWCCRTHNRRDLRAMCEQVGLEWKAELWATKWQQMFRSGGICVELQRA